MAIGGASGPLGPLGPLRSFAPFLQGVKDPVLRRSVQDRRTYWQVKYRDGRIINEFDPGVDWLHIAKDGLVEIRLLCPNRQVAVIGNTAGDRRLFQFKVAVAMVSLNGSGGGRGTFSHVIGRVTDTKGHCTCYAFDARQGRLVGPWDDSVASMQYENIGLLNWDVLGITPD